VGLFEKIMDSSDRVLKIVSKMFVWEMVVLMSIMVVVVGGGGGDVSSPSQTPSEDDGGVVVVTDDIEFANSPEAANKNQTHFKVSCSCDNGKTKQCGIDSILFSDVTYSPSCTAAYDTTEGKMNTLHIQSQNDCTLYCTTDNTTSTQQQNTINKNNNNGAVVGGVYEEMTSSTNDNNNNKPSSSSSSPLLYSCSCFNDINWNTSIATNSCAAAVACDDTKANYNDGSGLGTTNCYEQVGVNTDIDCPPNDTDAAAAGGIDGRMVFYYDSNSVSSHDYTDGLIPGVSESEYCSAGDSFIPTRKSKKGTSL